VKLVTYAHDGAEQAGVVVGERVFSLESLGLPASIVDFLALEDTGMERLSTALQSVRGGVPVSDVKLLPVIPRPPAIYLLAGNYQSHIVEGGGSAVNKDEITPRLFIKPVTSVIGDGDPILIPSVSDTVDYELEIAAVIGKRCKNVSVDSAYDVVAGYVVFNDISARNLTTVAHRKERPGDGFFDWLVGKWCDSFAAIGPQLITRDEIPEPTDLEMSLSVNGTVKQHSSAGEMIFTVPEAIAYLSQFVTIEAGSLICMGTPGGVGDATNTYLQPGDVVVAEIEKLGRLENVVR
jgi:2-keto-4-pentenoate hydratase/2-oxohepta-3-ene-1,7-dioic acid hydratase in catechol pathway